MPFTIQQDLLVGGRSDLARLCDYRGIKVAVEIGTDRGVFAREFLDKWHGEMFYCVDPYKSYSHMPWDRSSDLLIAALHLQPHLPRVRFLRTTSVQASHYFTREEPLFCPVGFVYIDGNHTLESVREDITVWWPIVAAGGVIAGDDFDLPEVRAAVIEFAKLYDVPINTVPDFNRAMNWWVAK